MGFNNDGTELIKKRLKKSFNVIGGNIGKNKITPNSDAKSDYTIAQVNYIIMLIFCCKCKFPKYPWFERIISAILNDLFSDLNKIRLNL